MIYPLVREMAAADAPVRVPAAVASRVLGFTEQAYYKWLKQSVSAREVEEAHLIGVLRELHEDDLRAGTGSWPTISPTSATSSASGACGGCVMSRGSARRSRPANADIRRPARRCMMISSIVTSPPTGRTSGG